MEGLAMKVAIIGAGAIGKLLASYYAKQHEVTLVTRRQAQADVITAHGITKISEAGTIKYNVRATTTLPSADIYLVTVKYHHLQAIQPLLAQVATTLVFLQNGLAHQAFAEQFSCDVVIGTLTTGAETKDETTVYERGRGVMKIAAAKAQVIWQLNQQDLPLVQADSTEVLWQKAMINSLINPLTALLNLTNGELISNPYAYQLMQLIYQELIEAFPEKKHLLVFEDVVQLCHNTAKNTSSMRADFLAERKSELATIVGEIVAEAAAKQCQLPTLQTVYYALLAIEERRSK